MYNSYLEVDLAAIKNNINITREKIGPKLDIIAVLKGNAYGLGLTQIGKFLADNCDIRTFGCASVYEAVSLRETGVNKNILVLGGVPYHNIKPVVEYDFHTPAFEAEYLRLLEAEAKKAAKTVYVHIKIETGLNRIGVCPGSDLDELCEYIKTLEHVKVRGVFTHFIESGKPDKKRTHEQMDKFKEGLAQVRSHGFTPDFVHVSNTAASTWLSDDEITHIRPGGLLYGFDDNFDEKMYSVNLFALKEAASWRTFITNVKTVPVGETVGYDGVFKVTKPTKVATVGMGYGDGYTRTLGISGKAWMLVNGKKAPVIAICMDQLFLDVSGIDDVSINDRVTVLGRDGDECISIFDFARVMNQTHLALMSLISQRVGRTYINS